MVCLRRVIFISQRQAEQMKPSLSTCIISITDPQRAEAQLQGGWLGTLRLSFHDVDKISFPGANRDLQPLSGQQAEDIAAFLQRHSRVATRLVVHCRHGSRVHRPWPRRLVTTLSCLFLRPARRSTVRCTSG